MGNNQRLCSWGTKPKLSSMLSGEVPAPADGARHKSQALQGGRHKVAGRRRQLSVRAKNFSVRSASDPQKAPETKPHFQAAIQWHTCDVRDAKLRATWQRLQSSLAPAVHCCACLPSRSGEPAGQQNSSVHSRAAACRPITGHDARPVPPEEPATRCVHPAPGVCSPLWRGCILLMIAAVYERQKRQIGACGEQAGCSGAAASRPECSQATTAPLAVLRCAAHLSQSCVIQRAPVPTAHQLPIR